MKRRALLSVLAMIPMAFALGQADTSATVMPDSLSTSVAGDVEIPEDGIWSYDDLKVKPQFPGGEEAYYEWLSQRIQYPAPAMDAGIQGTVYVEFVIGRDGGVQDVKLLRGVEESLDAEAMQALQDQPKWKPGEVDGIPVATRATMPVVFHLR